MGVILDVEGRKHAEHTAHRLAGGGGEEAMLKQFDKGAGVYEIYGREMIALNNVASWQFVKGGGRWKRELTQAEKDRESLDGGNHRIVAKIKALEGAREREIQELQDKQLKDPNTLPGELDKVWDRYDKLIEDVRNRKD